MEPGVTINFGYDANGNLLTRNEVDTSGANAGSRTWTYTWANSLLTSVSGPRTDVSEVTSFFYDASGALTRVVNALGQVTKVTRHTPGGYPETIVDPNNVTTTLVYYPRLWLRSSTVHTAAGALTTSLAYDAAGDVTRVTEPDGSYLGHSYDPALRLIATADPVGDRANYTLDALGDRTATTLLTGGKVTWKDTASFDALGRNIVDRQGAGQTTSTSYNPDGQPLTTLAPLSRLTQRGFRCARAHHPGHRPCTRAQQAFPMMPRTGLPR